MFGKYSIFIAFLAFMTMKLAYAQHSTLMTPRPIKCYTCDSPKSCRSPSTVICDHSSANTTRYTLEKHFVDVPNPTNANFQCVKIRYSSKNTTVLAVKGCVYVGLNSCRLHPKNVSLTVDVCKNCNTTLCNPSATFSSSSAIMMSTTFGLLLLKFLYF